MTLKPRINVAATRDETDLDPDELPTPVDPRQMSLFGAGWTLGSIKYLAENGIQSVTFYETTGWHGLMETTNGSSLPDKFHSIPGGVYPLYHVFADVGAFSEGWIIRSKSSDPLRVESLVLQKRDQQRVMITNLENIPNQIQLENLSARVQLKILDETTVLEAMQSPEKFRQQAGEIINTQKGCLAIQLKPYAIARIDTIGA